MIVYILHATLSILLFAAPLQNKPDENTSADLQGTYILIGGEKFGEKLSDEKIKGQAVRFTSNRITATDKDSKETFVATYTLNTTTTPWTISMKSVLPQEGMVSKGMVKREGDTVWLIYSHPGGEAPTEFKTKDKQLMVIMKKMK